MKQFFESENITQKEFAERLDSTQQYVSALLNGKRKVGSNIIERLEIEFNLNTSWLFTGEGPMKKGEGAQKPDANDEQQEYRPHDLNSVHLDLKRDIRELAKGVQENFKVVNDAMVKQLMSTQKILDSVQGLNAKEISSVTRDLKKLLEQNK